MNLLVVVLLLAQPGKVEVFADRDQTYVRAGTAQGLQVGQSLPVVSKDGKSVGSAVTLEVWEALARVKLDEPAEHFSGPKRALVAKGPEADEPPAEQHAQPEEGDSDDATAQKTDAEEEDDAAPVKPGELRGRASVIGVWQGKRITIENTSRADWHHCRLRLPDQRRYELGDLAQHDTDHVMLFRFEGANFFSVSDVPLDSIQVKCDEGSAKFPMSP